MISRRLLSQLHLDPEFIERNLKISQGLGLGYGILAQQSEHDSAKDAYMISATHFRRAASHALLLGWYGPFREPDSSHHEDHVSAYELFESALSAYQSAGTPYSLFLSIFIPWQFGEQRHTEYPWNELTERIADFDYPQLLYWLLYMSALSDRPAESNQQFHTIRQGLELYRMEPIGVLGVPIGAYLDLIDSFINRSEDIENVILPFLSQYDFSIRQAQKNEYHWQRLAMPFHPVEPDIFGTLLFAQRVLPANGDSSLLELIQRLPMSHETKSLLVGVLSDYDHREGHAGLHRL